MNLPQTFYHQTDLFADSPNFSPTNFSKLAVVQSCVIYQNVTITEKVLVHSTIMVVMEKPPAALLVVPPKDGETAYKWERKRLYMDGWDNIDVSPYACLLYVDEARQYRHTE